MAFAKAQAMSRNFSDRLQASISGVTYAQYLDAASMPETLYTKGSENIWVKMETEPDAAAPVDALGLTQRLYSPHRVTLLQDGDTVSDKELRAKVLDLAGKQGCKVLLYEINTLPATYTLAGATLVATIPSDPWNPLTQSE